MDKEAYLQFKVKEYVEYQKAFELNMTYVEFMHMPIYMTEIMIKSLKELADRKGDNSRQIQ